MGSMATSDVTTSNTDNENILLKDEPIEEAFTPDSESLSPEPDSAVLPHDGTSTQDPPPIPKRKGGRKPIYATSEERKQRNRQAQAAFRERRTEYIKQLEATIQTHEENLANLQQSHRTAADECLMLRYKNSLLERILLEKGIDVQGELRLKSSPHLGPIRHRAMGGQGTPMQKAMLNRQQSAARQRPAMAPPPIQTHTPPSQRSSPSTTRSPGFPMHGLASPTTDLQPRQQYPQHRQMQSMGHAAFQQQQQQRSHNRSMSAHTMGQPYSRRPMHVPVSQTQANYYPSSFQKHYDQLDQEYDAQVDMLDDIDGDDVDPDSFIPNFRLPPQTGNGAGMGMQASPPTTATTASDAGGHISSLPFDYDPMLDADPFGLSASMHFPNPFNGLQGQRR